MKQITPPSIIYCPRGEFSDIPSTVASSTLPSMNRTWITFKFSNCFTEDHEGPCFPGSTSHDIVSNIEQCFMHAFLMLLMESSSKSSNDTYSGAPTQEYFWALSETYNCAKALDNNGVKFFG